MTRLWTFYEIIKLCSNQFAFFNPTSCAQTPAPQPPTPYKVLPTPYPLLTKLPRRFCAFFSRLDDPPRIYRVSDHTMGDSRIS